MVYYITAHEMAHQWWGHQVCPAGVRGGEMITESLAQYSALMVMEKTFSRQEMKKFLAYELDRYLNFRGQERDEELPLAQVEGQDYIYYMKGSLAFYALRDYIGEDLLNQALREFADRFRFNAAPYPTTTDLLTILREKTPPRYGYLIDDMFEKIILYDNRIEEASATLTEDGRYRVRLAYQTHKLKADGHGLEQEVPHRDWIEVAVYGKGDDGADDKELYREKVQLESGSGEMEIVVDEQPTEVGIDPRHLLIDRVPDDNLKSISG
jgi:ABC-2 type transport system permease protein